jgi:NADPH-dependent ferric siderophore reductase
MCQPCISRQQRPRCLRTGPGTRPGVTLVPTYRYRVTDLDFDDSEALAARMAATRMDLTVREIRPLSPSMVRVLLTGDALRQFAAQPGQDLMVTATPPPDAVRRRWTISSLDREAGTVALDVVLHPGDAVSRLHEASPGDVVEAIGPRGKVHLVQGAAVHHFLGDQSFLPAAFVMAAAVQPPARAVVTLTVPAPEDRLELDAAACPEGVTWVEPVGDDEATGRALLAASGLAAPEDGVVAYVGGEMSLASTIRSALVRDLGWSREAVMPKPYWRRGAPNARHGEPGRD